MFPIFHLFKQIMLNLHSVFMWPDFKCQLHMLTVGGLSLLPLRVHVLVLLSEMIILISAILITPLTPANTVSTSPGIADPSAAQAWFRIQTNKNTPITDKGLTSACYNPRLIINNAFNKRLLRECEGVM